MSSCVCRLAVYTRGMTLCMRKTLTWLTVLALVLTGHAMAVARGMPGAMGYAEYCIGESSVMVAVDAEGNPTGESHICPDVSLSLLSAVAVAQAESVAPDSKVQKAVVVVATTTPVIRIFKGSARAPPLAA